MQALQGIPLGAAVLPAREATARRAPAAAAARAAARAPAAAAALPRLACRGAARRATRSARGRAVAPPAATAVVAAATDTFVPVLSLTDLPKGSRQQVSSAGKSALLFWYRDEVYAVEARSPAEGAYSEGFLTARFTQDGCIECPTTKTTFDLKTGEIKAWYPDNPVLRALTPIDTCRPMEVFPVRVADGTIAVDFANSNLAAGAAEGAVAAWTAPTTSGGANTSKERNNVYGIEPRVYLQDGREVSDATGKPKIDPATLIIGTVALAIVAVAGTAVAISKESIVGGVIFWIALLTPVGVFVFKNAEEGEGPK